MDRSPRDILVTPLQRRSFLKAAAAVAGAGALAASPMGDALARSHHHRRRRRRRRLDRAAHCRFGAHVSTTEGIAPQDAIQQLEGELGQRFTLDRQYYKGNEQFPSPYDYWTASQGRTPVLSFKSPIPWADVAAGTWDAHLNQIADNCIAFAQPMFLTFFHEPENDQATFGTPADYVAAWRHAVNVFRDKGVSNVSWTTCLMGSTYWDKRKAARWYPGDAYVDYIGADAYNWGPSSEVCVNGQWTSFRWRVQRFYTYGRGRRKPMLILETGCAEDPANPQRKADWILEMAKTLRSMPAIRGVCWFEAGKSTGNKCDWFVESSAASTRAMSRAMAEPYFVHGAPAL
jgi:Glycosyl hydrolase family 26/TAT (twin-arginine translocation) pathway signal sequence